MADTRFCVGFSSACKQAREGGGLPASEGGLMPCRNFFARRCWLPPDVVRLIDALVRRLEHEDVLLAMNGGVLGATLCQAADAGGLLDMRFLLANGADLEHTTVFVNEVGDELDFTALNWAAVAGHLAVCIPLLDAGAVERDRALRNASLRGHTPVVALLLDRGADVHVDDGRPLAAAVYGGHLATATLLLDRGADIHARDDKPLRKASQSGHFEMVRLLLDRGADLHAEEERSLLLAVESGHLEVVRLLLDRGADIHARTETALRRARRKGHAAVEALLMERGALELHA